MTSPGCVLEHLIINVKSKIYKQYLSVKCIFHQVWGAYFVGCLNSPQLIQLCSLSIRLLGRPVGVHQGSRTNNSPTIDRSLGYDDIRLCQMIRNSNISEESCSTSSRRRMTNDSVKSRHLLSIIYDNYHEDDEDYSRLLLRKRQSVCIAKKNIAYDDDGYAFLQLGITELKPDLVIRRHRSLPLISSIQNSISLDSQDVKRCLSESNIPLWNCFIQMIFLLKSGCCKICHRQKQNHNADDYIFLLQRSI